MGKLKKLKTKIQNEISDITTQQLIILKFLYKFLYLNRIQIQELLNQKSHHRVIKWLNNLVNEKYLKGDFKQSLGNVATVYALGLKGRKRLLKEEGINKQVLERVYQEKRVSETYKKHWMVLGNIYISLLELCKKHKATLKLYTRVDLYNFKHLPPGKPDLFFSIEENSGLTKRYFLDYFDENSTDGWLYKRSQQYLTYYQDSTWQDHNKNPFPEIIFILHTDKKKDQMEEYVEKILQEEPDMIFSLSTLEEINQKGLTKEALHRVVLN